MHSKATSNVNLPDTEDQTIDILDTLDDDKELESINQWRSIKQMIIDLYNRVMGRKRKKNQSNNKLKVSPVKRCYKAGKRTNNPFLNFLRKFRIDHCDMSITQMAKLAGETWNKMSITEQLPYIMMANRVRETKWKKYFRNCQGLKAKPRRRRTKYLRRKKKSKIRRNPIIQYQSMRTSPVVPRRIRKRKASHKLSNSPEVCKPKRKRSSDSNCSVSYIS